jgi:putative ABC transport system permease protein
MFKRYFHDIVIAVESIISNKLKSILTALGIIFGVAAVISMLAIGKGAQQEILDQIKMVGVNNILISPVIEEKGESSEDNGGQQQNKFSRGLTILDVDAIRENIPSVKSISPEIAYNSNVVLNGIRYSAKLVGVKNDYFGLYNLPLQSGVFFNDYQEVHGIQVCIIGSNIRSKFFSKVDPIGQYIKFDGVWLKIIGVLEKTNVSLTGFEDAGINVYNDNIYIPVKTMLMRYQNRALAQTRPLNNIGNFRGMGGMGRRMVILSQASGSGSTNYHQLDRIVVQVEETEQLNPTTEVLSRMLLRRHMGVKDFEITVPELLLKQQQRTKDIFNIVLGAIASISLVVGGIGIMNIMFASVMERIKEIGTRMAIGAKKMDIVVQFLSEAVLISVSGGFIGVIMGVILSMLIQQIADINTIVTPFSVIVAFGVSAAVGVIFGYSPAKRASERDPIESLRYE